MTIVIDSAFVSRPRAPSVFLRRQQLVGAAAVATGVGVGTSSFAELEGEPPGYTRVTTGFRKPNYVVGNGWARAGNVDGSGNAIGFGAWTLRELDKERSLIAQGFGFSIPQNAVRLTVKTRTVIRSWYRRIFVGGSVEYIGYPTTLNLVKGKYLNPDGDELPDGSPDYSEAESMDLVFPSGLFVGDGLSFFERDRIGGAGPWRCGAAVSVRVSNLRGVFTGHDGLKIHPLYGRSPSTVAQLSWRAGADSSLDFQRTVVDGFKGGGGEAGRPAGLLVELNALHGCVVWRPSLGANFFFSQFGLYVDGPLNPKSVKLIKRIY